MEPPRARIGTRAPSPDELRRSWIAARLSGVGVEDVPSWTKDQGLPTASKTSFQRAVGPVRAGATQQSWPDASGTGGHEERPLLRDWLLVDEAQLGIKKVVYRIANDGLVQPELIAAIALLEGVRQVLETSSDRMLIIVALVCDDPGARDLRARIEELAPGRAVRMDDVTWEDHSPAARAWVEVARRMASGGAT